MDIFVLFFRKKEEKTCELQQHSDRLIWRHDTELGAVLNMPQGIKLRTYFACVVVLYSVMIQHGHFVHCNVHSGLSDIQIHIFQLFWRTCTCAPVSAEHVQIICNLQLIIINFLCFFLHRSLTEKYCFQIICKVLLLACVSAVINAFVYLVRAM